MTFLKTSLRNLLPEIFLPFCYITSSSWCLSSTFPLIIAFSSARYGSHSTDLQAMQNYKSAGVGSDLRLGLISIARRASAARQIDFSGAYRLRRLLNPTRVEIDL